MKFSFLLVFAFSLNSLALHPAVPAEDVYFQNVIYLEAESHSKDGDVIGSCSATLLSNEFAVTAAHCLWDSALAGKYTLHIQVGKYKYVKRAADGKTVRIGYVRYLDQRVPCEFFFLRNPKGKNIAPADDVAVIKFHNPLPLDAHFVFAQVLSRQDFVQLKGTIAPNTLGAVSINYVAEVSNTDVKRLAFFDRVSWHRGLSGEGWFTSTSTARVEGDDSGAPLFVVKGADHFLAAVVKGRAQNAFSNWDVFAAVPEALCRIAGESRLQPSALFCR